MRRTNLPLDQQLETGLVDIRVLGKELQRRADRGEMIWSELARDLGMVRYDKGKNHPAHADISQLRRRLGISPQDSHGRKVYSRRARYQTAVKICRAAGIDPVDVGL